MISSKNLFANLIFDEVRKYLLSDKCIEADVEGLQQLDYESNSTVSIRIIIGLTISISLSLSLFGYKEEKLVCIVTRFFNDAWCIAIPRDYLSIRESNFPARISRYVFMSRIIFHGSSLFGLSSRARNSDELSIVEQTCVCRSRRRYWQPCLLQSIVHCPADDRYFTKGN